MQTSGVWVGWVTFPDEQSAASAARTLVERGVIACGNLIPGVRSIYRWEGRIEEESEVLLVCKLSREKVDELKAGIRALHPYENPELLLWPVADGLPDYLAWVLGCKSSEGSHVPS